MRTLRVKGLNIKRYLNELIDNKISPKKIKTISHDEIIIDILNRDYKKLVDLKKTSCYNINVIKSTPDHPWIDFLISRCGLIIGFFASISILFNITSKVWQINITCLGDKNPQLITEVATHLEKIGIGTGKRFIYKSRELEKELLRSVDSLSIVVVKKNGISLDIEIKERVDETLFSESNIIANYSGKITDINLTGGILMVNVGEGVSEGQVLIASGYVGDFYSEAIGDIYARVLISGEAVGGLTTENFVRSGELVEIEAFEICGKTIFLDKNRTDIYGIYPNYEIEKQEVFVSNNMVLPLKKTVYKVFELKPMEKLVDEETLLNRLKNKAYEIAKNNLPSDAEELGVSYDIFNNNGYYKVVCNIETEVSIGIRN